VLARPSTGAWLSGRGEVADWWHDVARDSEFEARPLEYEVAGRCIVVRGYLRRRSGRVLAESQMYWVCEINDGQVVRLESHPSRGLALTRC
jgi:hypothetical protein